MGWTVRINFALLISVGIDAVKISQAVLNWDGPVLLDSTGDGIDPEMSLREKICRQPEWLVAIEAAIRLRDRVGMELLRLLRRTDYRCRLEIGDGKGMAQPSSGPRGIGLHSMSYLLAGSLR